MRLISVNVGQPRIVQQGDRQVRTGIFKSPVKGRVRIRALGVEGDGQADPSVHGGADMAAYAYPVEHYAFWEAELERPGLGHGQFGENLTVEGLLEDAVRIGDTYRVGDALLQVTQPRTPCYKLGLRMAAGADFPKRFLRSRRLGFYCRVLEEGETGAHDAITLVERDAGSVTIADCVEVMRFRRDGGDGLSRVLASPGLSDRWRAEARARLDAAAT